MASSGHLGAAAAIAQRALDMAPADLPAGWRWQLLSTRARLVLLENEARPSPDAESVQEALRQIERAQKLVGEDQEQARLILGVHAAIARKLMGNTSVAARTLEDVRDQAKVAKQPLAEALAGLALARLLREQDALDGAERVLLALEDIVAEGGYVDEAFELYFELHLISRCRGDGKHQYYLRRCRRFYPLVQAKTPQVLAYEKIARSMA
jgi:hypothetical protein